MKRLITSAIATVVLFVAVLGTSMPAQAGTATDVALGLASFAVFSQLVGAFTHPYPPPVYAAPAPVVVAPPVYAAPAPVIVAPAPVVYRPAPVYAAPLAPVYVGPRRTVVAYPHGYYVLRHQTWVWVPTAPAAPYAHAAPIGY